MSKVPPELLAHREWLGQIGQVGLVVSANVLVKHGVFINKQRAVEAQTQLRSLIPEDDEQARVFGVERIFREVLGWPAELLAGGEGGPELPESLTIALPAYEDYVKPTYAVPAPGGTDWLLLIDVVKPGVDLDKAAPPDADGWRASPQARFERLLRETGVGIGILINGVSLRLVYAPKGESSGYLTFTFRYLLETQGRPMAGALCALLDPERVSDVGAEPQRLPALLTESRKSQNDVSTHLAEQVLEALWELVRGFQQANDSTQGQLLGEALREDSREVYGGMLTTLMRLVFILYAEDRSLMPAGDVYQRHYSVTGLFERLREDQARHPDTMDARYGAWGQLLALFRLIHDGGQHGDLRFVARHGRLFAPDAYPFLEGRPHGTTRSMGERTAPPKVSDGTIYRVLSNLLILNGERLSYRTLDVEQIGSVYEAMMGFALEQATGPSIAVSPKHIVINLQDLLDQTPKERAKWLSEHAELKLPPKAPIVKAGSIDELVSALGKKVSRYTPLRLPVGALYLQPTEERRRSGSHYTPRTLTEPIVRTTFRPIFDRLGENATPDEILDLKVCDPAMGSGAFLVESCRFLAEKLVKAWEVHKATPTIPDDEDVLTFARRLVAERCLYGVDKNIFAVDLAKLSLWLATLAKEHPFTFLDHSLRHGDSLVGLSREQITTFLLPGGAESGAASLKENEHIAFLGSKPYGLGFVFAPDGGGGANTLELMHELLAKNQRNQERIRPYVGGREVNDSATHQPLRFVIDFGALSEEESWAWPDLMRLVETKVKPERLLDNREVYRRLWWQFGERRVGLYSAVAGLSRVLALSRHGEALSFAFLPNDGLVFAESLVVLALQEYSAFSVLQSRVHELWARLFSSSIKDDLRYTPSECFESFPFPPDWRTSVQLDDAGRRFYKCRADLMLDRGIGLTSTFNRFHDRDDESPDIVDLRNQRELMDRAVLDAYGWPDIKLSSQFVMESDGDSDDRESGAPGDDRRTYRYRWVDGIADEVLGRLLELNSKRAREEAAMTAATAVVKPSKKAKKSAPLFD